MLYMYMICYMCIVRSLYNLIKHNFCISALLDVSLPVRAPRHFQAIYDRFSPGGPPTHVCWK